MTDLERILARTLLEVLIFVDIEDDDADPDLAMKLLAPVTAVLHQASVELQLAVADVIHQCAREETDPERRLTILDLPEALGLMCP
jgi:hypothetical protein